MSSCVTQELLEFSFFVTVHVSSLSPVGVEVLTTNIEPWFHLDLLNHTDPSMRMSLPTMLCQQIEALASQFAGQNCLFS